MKRCNYCGRENEDSAPVCGGCGLELKWHFPMPMTIRCFQCGKVFEVASTSEERHEFPCPACGKIEVYNLGAIKDRVAEAEAKKIRKSSGGSGGRFKL
jgi:phage FluMu protein Com